MLTSGTPPKGLEQSFASMLQISPSMWSQIKSSRPIGDKLARQIEKHCKMPGGWLDEFVGATVAKPSDKFQALRKAGDTLMVAVPKRFAKENGLREGALVELKYSGKKLTVAVADD
ncbi:MAG: AbrB/MazE/SpoVT family DNA-binding domain-containing protein [Zoogloeaceae bacterium]|nr:AbrB/MazE/SpoVT family DNA-binding domain-containing protein [Zoogloeaceae bacterium]